MTHSNAQAQYLGHSLGFEEWQRELGGGPAGGKE